MEIDTEQKLFELWKELHPSQAFNQGLSGYAGKLFIPKKAEKEKILARIKSLKKQCKTKLHRKFLLYLETELTFEEPESAPDKILWTFFGHMAKEGIDTKHLLSLAENSMALIDIYTELGYEWSVELKILTYRNCKGLIGILESIKNQTNDRLLISKLEELKNKVQVYMKNFYVQGLDKCDFSEIYPILKKTGGELNRKKIYPTLLTNLYDFYESPDEIERNALGWLKNELPILKKITAELAKIYHIEPDTEKISEHLAKRTNLSKKEIIDILSILRAKLRKIVEKELVKISPRYDTRVIETPSYLVPFIPSAAMSSYDTLTEKPFCVFFVTTDEKFAPPTGFADIFQVLVHEEYGHCVNFTNSALDYVEKLSVLEKVNTTFHYPISEGISFHREIESLELLRTIAKKKVQTQEEKELLRELKKYGEINLILKEMEFVVYEWRIIRFLRAISDVRINTGKQGIAEFVDWAYEYTGLSKKMIFNQIFIFQDSPGYAPCYSIAGMALKKLQDIAKKSRKSRVEFNTLACSLGAPPRTIFEHKLREYGRKK